MSTEHELTPIAAAVQTSATSADKPLFDFRGFEDLPSTEITIKDPTTNRPTSMVVELAGVEHPARKRRLFDRQRWARSEVARTGKPPVLDPLESEEMETDDLVACTLSWRGCAVPFTKEAVRSAFTDPKLRWFRDQVKAALDDRELFIRGSVDY